MTDTQPTENPPANPLGHNGSEIHTEFTRFEIELEFVQMLGNPLYLNHLAAQHLLEDSSFIAYLHYLQYFTTPEYVKYLNYPGPTLKALELLQEEEFRRKILSPEVTARLSEGWARARIGA